MDRKSIEEISKELYEKHSVRTKRVIETFELTHQYNLFTIKITESLVDVCKFNVSVNVHNIKTKLTKPLTFGDYAQTVCHRSVEDAFQDGVNLVLEAITEE